MFGVEERTPGDAVNASDPARSAAGVVARAPHNANVARGRGGANSAGDDWRAQRKAEPANILLPLTRQWIAALPAAIRPQALLRAYPRIANRIAADWGERAACLVLLHGLVTDRRGSRSGFPPEVYAELVELQRYFTINRPGDLGMIDWKDPGAGS